MSKRTTLITASLVAIVALYLAAWLMLAHYFVANSTGGLVMVLLCYWLAWAAIGAVLAVVCYAAFIVLIVVSKRRGQE